MASNGNKATIKSQTALDILLLQVSWGIYCVSPTGWVLAGGSFHGIIVFLSPNSWPCGKRCNWNGDRLKSLEAQSYLGMLASHYCTIGL